MTVEMDQLLEDRTFWYELVKSDEWELYGFTGLESASYRHIESKRVVQIEWDALEVLGI